MLGDDDNDDGDNDCTNCCSRLNSKMTRPCIIPSSLHVRHYVNFASEEILQMLLRLLIS